MHNADIRRGTKPFGPSPRPRLGILSEMSIRLETVLRPRRRDNKQTQRINQNKNML